MLDVTTPKLYPKLIEFKYRAQSWERKYCFIPQILMNQIQTLFPESNVNSTDSPMATVNDKKGFIGILTQDQHSFITLYAFRSINGAPQITGRLMVLPSKDARNPPFRRLVHCGSHGIIGMKGFDIYQLKMEDINEHFEFTQIGTLNVNRNLWTEYTDHLAFKWMYIEERDVLLVMHLSDRLTAGKVTTFQCRRYNFNVNQWQIVFTSRNILLYTPKRLRWNVCYDRNVDALYFVSNMYHVMRYGMKTRNWKLVTNGSDRKIYIQALWASEMRAGVLCCIVSEVGSMWNFKELDLNDINEAIDPADAWKPYEHRGQFSAIGLRVRHLSAVHC